MEADWEIEVGGGAPVIEAFWPGFVDLHRRAGHHLAAEIAEARAFPPLAGLLQALNSTASPVFTSKCDLWETGPDEVAGSDELMTGDIQAALACYIDLLPVEGAVFPNLHQAEEFCRNWVRRLSGVSTPLCRVDLILRQAIAGPAEGFGVTAYLGGTGKDRSAAGKALASAMAAFAVAIPDAATTAKAP
jgi:hypothetical protein